MITYVNTVFVSNDASSTAVLSAIPTAANAATNKGKFIVYDVDKAAFVTTAAGVATANRIKVGIITGKTFNDQKGVAKTDIRWSNVINKADIKAFAQLKAPAGTVNTEDEITVDFTGIDAGVLAKLAEGGKRVIVRLTFKDLPTRFRKWTESYEYVTQAGDDDAALAQNIATLINKQWKRARVVADGTTTAGQLVLTAMPYDDDDSVDTINWANKVRFNANVYYTDPAAEGWESLNKFFPTGVTITKVPGFRYAADAKLVRDRESQAMGYLGILNRGEGTWPIIKPNMETNLSNKYNACTLEFENMYRAADDIFRKTKQTLEIYLVGNTNTNGYTASTGIYTILAKFAEGAPLVDAKTEDNTADNNGALAD